MSDTTTHLASGKVRELYSLDEDRLLLVASDRISVFDVVLPTEIPDKGRVLTGLSGYWFAQTAAIVPNHLLALRDDGRSTVCRRLEMLPLECVVRGYLSGSGWKDYRATGAVSGPATTAIEWIRSVFGQVQLPRRFARIEQWPARADEPLPCAGRAHRGHWLWPESCARAG